MPLILVLGGTSSGKSGFAVDLATSMNGEVTFLATGRATDPEMAIRIEAHREQRPTAWQLIEEPLDIGRRAIGSGIVVLDSVDAWVANHMERDGGPEQNWTRNRLSELEGRCLAAIADLAAGHRLIAVSSEVGLSLVSLHPYGRAFTDVLGRLNQRLASRSDEAYLVVAGVPIHLDAKMRTP
ncbi:MAG: bifunctional adenosylcobinamide kinase/adenosylcobinamide-phosphate guanylyltransferase [Candidatus Dormibacteria bacterium]